jgi:hypothetical protein
MRKKAKTMINRKTHLKSVVVKPDGRTKQAKLAKLSWISTGGSCFKNQPEAVIFLQELH